VITLCRPTATMLAQISSWLADHALAVQAAAAIASLLLTLALVITTIAYAAITRRILVESRKSREATERQADVANTTLRLLQQRDEEDRIRGLQELRAVIADALDLARTWMHYVPGMIPSPQAIPDPSQITENRLLDVRSHARRISAHCESLVFDAHTALRNARAQFEKLRQATHGPTTLRSPAGNPQPFLDATYDRLLEARRIVDSHDPQARSEGQGRISEEA
jgi:hypothetical protein